MAVTLFIDGGTTNTRFTLVRAGEVLERVSRHVGASNASAGAAHPRNEALCRAVRDEIAAIPSRCGVTPDTVCVSGMITSGSGLVEVPHLPAPAGRAELARGVRAVTMPEVCPQPILCVPGVKCTFDGETDMMRGEETEVIGALDGTERGTRAFLHFGSHNKLILVEDGRIVRSRTTLTGELLSAVLKDTILRGTLGELTDFALQKNFARRGFVAAGTMGLSRALFQTRLLQVLSGEGRDEAFSFLLGALCQQDAMAFAPLLMDSATRLTLYGRDVWTEAFRCCASGAPAFSALDAIPFERAEWLSLRGMERIVSA